LYLRRKALEGALEKLKNGESIGPVTKASMDGKEAEEEDDDDNTTQTTEPSKGPDDLDEVKEEEDGVVKKKGESSATGTPCSEASTSSGSSKPPSPPVEPLDPPGPKVAVSENEDGYDTNSNASDIPPTPASTDIIPESGPSEIEELIDANLREERAIRASVSETHITPDSITSIDDALSKSVSNEEQEPRKSDETASQATVKAVTLEDGTDEIVEVICPASTPALNTMEGWEMLEMVLNWIRKEFSPDEQALARQLANDEISYRFLWLYFIPGALISMEDPISKQSMAARVHPLWRELTVGRNYGVHACYE
jgi:hypothetical protein